VIFKLLFVNYFALIDKLYAKNVTNKIEKAETEFQNTDLLINTVKYFYSKKV